MEFAVRGSAITIFECRPPWSPEMGPDWSRLAIAQLRFDPNTKSWSVYWQRANGRWLLVEDQPVTADIGELLDLVEENPDGVFWG